MAKKKKVMLSAIKPTNRLTLGNYVGAMMNWKKLQSQYDCLFFAVDLHAITTRQDPKELREHTYFAISEFLAAGLDLEHCMIFVQSHVPEHTELAWILNCFAYMGELNRMTQYKDKCVTQGKNIGAGLFNYPVLMAADVLLYQTGLVPVGHDQKQHLELTRDLAMRINNHYGKELFTIPEVYIPEVGARIMDLQDPEKKMSKSEVDKGTVFISDTDKQIEKKIKSAVTDSGSTIVYSDNQPGVKNLLNIQMSLTGKNKDELEKAYEGKQYGHLKVDTAEIVVETLRPVRERAKEIYDDRASLEKTLARCAEEARERAQATLAPLSKAIGFLPRK